MAPRRTPHFEGAGQDGSGKSGTEQGAVTTGKEDAANEAVEKKLDNKAKASMAYEDAAEKLQEVRMARW